jgi:hypothetical protein
MSKTPTARPLLRLGRLDLSPGLRALQPGAAADPVVTATVEAPDSGPEPQYAWDVAWTDAVREAGRLGADQRTAQALATGAGDLLAAGTRLADDTRVVVAAHGEVLLARWLPAGAATSSVRVGPLPYLREVAAAAARRPAHVVLLADRDGAAVFAHTAGDSHPARRYEASARPGLQRDPHPHRPPARYHGERHITDREPESGGERNAEFVANSKSPCCWWRPTAHWTSWSGPRCTRTRSSPSYRTAPARWPASGRRRCCAAERLTEVSGLLRSAASWISSRSGRP